MADMKLALVNWWPEPAVYPPLGLGYIASYIKKYGGGWDIRIFDSEISPFRSILEFRPDIIGLTSVTFNYNLIVNLAEKLKRYLNIPIIMGGPHISSLPDTLPSCIDIVVRTEGEETMLELLELYQRERVFSCECLSSIPGITYRKNGDIINTPMREFITPLDRIPPPDRNLLDMERYLRFNFGIDRFKRGISLLTSRGCPYRCIFCHSGSYWGKPRLNSSGFVAREIDSLYRYYKMDIVSIIDDLFIIDLQRIKELIKHLRALRLLGEMEFWVDGRVNLVNPSLLQLLRELNCTLVSLGIESVSDRLLKYIRKEGVTARDNIRAVKLINNFGMGVFVQVMIGIPTETEDDIKLTERFIKDVIKADRRNSISVSILTPYPGTPLWRYSKEKGLVDESMEWGLLEAKPHRLLKSRGKFVYLNEVIPKSRFLKIVAKFQAILDYQAFIHSLRRISLREIKKVFLKPARLWQLLKGVVKTIR